MSKTKVLFGLAIAMALPISIEAVAVAAAELTPPPAPPVPQVAPLEATFPLLIEAGSTQAYTDTQGRTWRADDGFIGGSVVDRGAIEIDGTTDDRIYQTERWGLTGYTAKVANGKYTVRLHFAETYQDAAAKRIFSVKVEDRTIANLDVFAEAGGKYKALVKMLDEVVVADGELNIDFNGAGAVVNGIEVAPVVQSVPPVVTLSGGSIRENAATGEQVATILAKGAAADVFSYALTNDANGRFAIDAKTGVISVKAGAMLDFEASSSHEIEVAATDAKGVTTKQRFTITVLDVNEPPSVLFMSAQSVEDAAPAGTVVGITSPVDPDANETFTYSLVDNAHGRFVIDAASGAVSVAANASLDHRVAPAHRIIVKATDSAGQAVTNGFTINVHPKATVAKPVLIEAGGTADFVDAKGRTWRADEGFIGGQAADRGAIEIAGTTDDRIYQTERWGMTGYSLPVAPGLYTVKLHFAETYATAAGARVFSVDVEGQKLTDLDVFAAVGGKTALVKTVPNVAVTDGKLDIAFTQKVGGAMVNAIEIEPMLNCQSTAQ